MELGRDRGLRQTLALEPRGGHAAQRRVHAPTGACPWIHEASVENSPEVLISLKDDSSRDLEDLHVRNSYSTQFLEFYTDFGDQTDLTWTYLTADIGKFQEHRP